MNTVLIGVAVLIVCVALALLWWDQRRTVAPNDEARRAARHAAYTSATAVACLAGGLLVFAGAVYSGSLAGMGRLLAVLPASAGALFIVAHAVGDLTWPGPRGRQREAGLEARTVGDLTPVRLVRWTWTTGALLAVSTVAFGLMASGPRTISRPVEAGRLFTLEPFPGWWFGVPVLVATVTIAVACAATLRVVVARPAVVGASAEWDRWLRRRSARRVLRGAQLAICLTFAGIANFASRALRGLGIGDESGHLDTTVHHGYLAIGTILLWLTIVILAVATLIAIVPIRDGAPDPEAAARPTDLVAS